jgi:hypothetical protein
MNTKRSIAFGSEGRYLTIELHERPYPNSDSEWDRGAIHATVIAEAGPFQARIATLVWDNDINKLLETLKNLSGMVGREASVVTTFGGYEKSVEVGFDLDKRGGLLICVNLVDDPLTTAKLWFEIECDQSYLAGWISDVENVLGSFYR